MALTSTPWPFDETGDSRFRLFPRCRFTPRPIGGAAIGADRAQSDHGLFFMHGGVQLMNCYAAFV
jgi:hypothetical protein